MPDGVEQVELDIYGAAGGDTTGSGGTANLGQGGLGAGVQNAILPVAPDDRLTVIVGGEGGPAEGPAGGWSVRSASSPWVRRRGSSSADARRSAARAA